MYPNLLDAPTRPLNQYITKIVKLWTEALKLYEIVGFDKYCIAM